MNKKRILALTMILILILSSTVMAYAEVQPRETGTVIFAINRTSRTSADATVVFTFTTDVDLYNVKVYLQKKVNDSWVADANNPDYFCGFTGADDLDFTFNKTYSSLESGVMYRLKCVSSDYIGDSSYTLTTYSDQF